MQKSYNILVIEENTAEVKLLEECLSLIKCDYTLSVAKTGEDAINFLFKIGNFQNAFKPDLIISDLTIPGASVFEILKLRKKNSDIKKIPFVILTNSEYSEDIELCKKLGVTAVYKKDTDLFKLLTILYQIIEWL